jgi:hypothetical protein
MALKIYTNATVYLRGKCLAEAATVKVDRKTNAQMVSTLGWGFAGVTPGAAVMEISIESKVPSADFELDAGQFFVDALVPVDLTIFAAGRTLSTSAIIHEDNFSAGVNQDSGVTASAWARMSNWE